MRGGVVALLALVAILSGGCVASNFAEVVHELGQDTATVCIRITSVYGTGTFLRSGIQGGDVSCDTLTIRSTPPTIPVSLQVVPRSR